uniref:FIP-RBD domain-containing protein n=1 Tax=Esox lucius TaxID=8010 RepID=A0A6Q2Y7Y1_ESOLU
MSQRQPRCQPAAESSNRNDGDNRTNSNGVRLTTTVTDKSNSKMEVFPDQEQLLSFLKKLKEVFDVCDEDADGFIRVEHFVDLGLQFGQGDRDEVKKLTKYLDPNAHGRINFKDFCYGVFAIKGSNWRQCVSSLPYSWSFYSIPIALSLTATRCCTQGGSHPPPGALPPRSFLTTSVTSARVMDESTSEPSTSGPRYANTHSSRGPRYANTHSSRGPAGQTPQKMRHLYNSELLDVYCSQCCKKVNLLNDLEARLKNLKANSPNRKISSTAFGRQLFQHNHSAFSSSQGSTEDLFRDSIDSCDVDITEKVSYLEKKVTELENDSLANGDLKSKLKQENTQLVHRVHELEEQLKDQETRAEQNLEEELRRHRETYSKMERDKNTDIELLSNRVQQLEEENGEMKINVCRLKSQTEKLDQEKQRMTDKLEDTSLRLKDEMDLYRKMMDKLWQNRHEFQKEREAMQELIEDLRRELEHLQLFKLGSEKGLGSGAGLSEYNAKTREIEMEHEVKRLKHENFKLRDQNDDLNNQILTLSLYEAKNLFACHTKAQSLAAEIDNASRDELVDALKEQEGVNFRLRQYMDKIILAILDHNPSILEIKSSN